MNDQIKEMLLRCIKENKTLEVVEKLGYDYAKIAEYYSLLIKNDFIVSQQSKYVLTDKGIKELELIGAIKSRNFTIKPYEYYRKTKIGLFDIYLP